VGYSKLFGFMSNMQLFFSNCSTIQLIQSKEIQGKKYNKENKENLKNGKVRFWLNIDVTYRKEKEDSCMAECNKTKKCIRKRSTKFFSSKITTAANAHVLESPLDNWLKNNHIIVYITTFCFAAHFNGHFAHYLKSLFESSDFYRF